MSAELVRFQFSVSDAVFDRFPDYVVGCVIASAIDNRSPAPGVGALLVEAEADARERFAGLDLKATPEIAAWRSAFAECGWTPSKYLSSVEGLLKRVTRGDALPRISPIVDLANAAALRYSVPIGAHDITVLPGDTLSVRFAAESDEFEPMGDGVAEFPEPGEIVYAAGASIRTRRWVWRQSRAALVVPTTSHVFFPIDGFTLSTGRAVADATTYLRDELVRLLGASVETGQVNSDRRMFETTPKS